MPDFHVAFRNLFTCRKSTTWDRRLYFPSEVRRAEDLFALKNPTASAGFEPANLGTKGQHATSRPPKPLSYMLLNILKQTQKLHIFMLKLVSFRQFLSWFYGNVYVCNSIAYSDVQPQAERFADYHYENVM